VLDSTSDGGGIVGSAPYNMTIDLAYVYPCGEAHTQNFLKFLYSYANNPPLGIHSTAILTDLGPIDDTVELARAFFEKPVFFQSTDACLDIGRYQDYAKVSTADVILFCGGTTYFRKPGWLHRVANSVGKYGLDALYGSMCNTGDLRFAVQPHLRTTSFWIGRELFNRYPIKITQKEQRYEFEHGATGLTSWIRQQGLKAIVVGWDSEYVWPNWNQVRLGFHQGDQENLLFGDRLSQPPYWDYA